MTAVNSDTVAGLMGRFRQGDRDAAGQLVELLYPELRRIAAARMRAEPEGHTWQATVLVNELYLELVKIKALRAAEDGVESEREAFLNLAAHIMRRLLITHARRLSRKVHRTELPSALEANATPQETVSAIDSSLDRLAVVDPHMRAIVELRVFEGLTLAEAANRLHVSPRTAARYWAFCQQWLAEEFGGCGSA